MEPTGGEIAEVVTLLVGGQSICVANQLSPMFMQATTESVQWLVNELYANLGYGGDASSTIKLLIDKVDDIDNGDAVICAEDSDDDDPEN